MVKKKLMKNIPQKIYLQVDDEAIDCEDFKELSETSWCTDKINNSDIKYVSQSVFKKSQDKIKMLEDVLKKVANWELPKTNEVWPESKNEVSFETNYGSNGVRNYFKNLAKEALQKRKK